MLTGKKLIQEINNVKVESGHLAFWWLGQFSFIVKTKKNVIYLDPFLSDHPKRRVASLLKPEEASNADIITGSHNHADHIDVPALPAIMNASPQSVLIIPKAVWPDLKNIDCLEDRVHPIDAGETYASDGVKVTAIKAAHEFFDKDAVLGYPYLGFVIEVDGVVIYHSGDTCIYDGMTSFLKQWDITVAFLPINGRDAKRLKADCIGNMTYQEAVDLAGAIKPKLTVPGHFEMFSNNMENPRLFADYMDVKYPDLEYRVPKHGETFYLRK